MIDLIARFVDGYGYLPIVADVSSGREYYRGEFQPTAEAAVFAAEAWYQKTGKSQVVQ